MSNKAVAVSDAFVSETIESLFQLSKEYARETKNPLGPSRNLLVLTTVEIDSDNEANQRKLPKKADRPLQGRNHHINLISCSGYYAFPLLRRN